MILIIYPWNETKIIISIFTNVVTEFSSLLHFETDETIIIPNTHEAESWNANII